LLKVVSLIYFKYVFDRFKSLRPRTSQVRQFCVLVKELLNGTSGEEMTFKDFNQVHVGLVVGSPLPRKGRNQHKVYGRYYVNDPSAGSPTETLLRLLLPLNSEVKSASNDIAVRVAPNSRMPLSGDFTEPFNR
jgi:hypothetical protein